MLYAEVCCTKRCEGREATGASVIERIPGDIIRCPCKKCKAPVSVKRFGCSQGNNLRGCPVYAQDDLIVGLVSIRGGYG